VTPLPMLDLFSGVGGFSLGLERSGLARTVAFCEIDPFCRKVLKKHWPKVPQYDDIRELTAARLAADGIERPRAICGGFPCQDISVAGRGAGLAGERSGLWREYARLIGELRPDFVFVENVAALLGRGLGAVLGDLAAFGYDAEWMPISAADVGAPHERERIWIVAYPDSARFPRPVIDGDSLPRLLDPQNANLGNLVATSRGRSWQDDFKDLFLDDGLPSWVVRGGVKTMGNAVVPQIPELLGRAVMRAMQ
jgi:DNA (cytosine-5)-methyltransferase 1